MTENEAKEYLELLPHLQRFQANLKDRLGRVTAGQAEIKSRIKTWESVREKLNRRKSSRLTDVADLLAFRVIVPDANSLLTVSEVLKSEFQITSMESWILQPEQMAMHFIVRGDSSFLPRVSAEIQVLTIMEETRQKLTHELLFYKSRVETRQEQQTAVEKLNRIIAQFEKLIEQPDVHEKRHVHPFLDKNHFLLASNPDKIVSEVAIGLGTKYRMDFLVRNPDGSYLLVEIENPQARLFLKSGDFSQALNHAVRQVEDWQEWIEKDIAAFERKYPGVRSPEALVVIGRDRDLSEEEKDRLARRNVSTRGSVKIRTYDDLLRDAKAYVQGFARIFNKSYSLQRLGIRLP